MKKEESGLSIRIRGESALFFRIRSFLASFFGVLFWIFYWKDCIPWVKNVSPARQLYQAFVEKGLFTGHFFEMGEKIFGFYCCAGAGILMMFLLFSVLGTKKLLIVGLTGGLALALLLRTGWAPGTVSLIFLCLCWLTLFVPSFKSGILLMAGATLILAFFSFGRMSEIEGWTGFREQWEEWRYNENAKILPRGQMEMADRQERGEKEALSIRMKQPSVYYLRGFTGTVFENNVWFNRQGTFPQYWQADERNHLAKTVGKYEGILKNCLEIQNVGASRRYLYLPYECTTNAAVFEGEKKAVYGMGDNYYAAGLTGARNYSCASWECAVNAAEKEEEQTLSEEYPLKSDLQNTPGADDREADSCHKYIHTTCLMLTKEEKETVAGLLGKKEANAGVSALSVLREIRKWMKDNLEYVTEPGKIPKGQSFVRWFLEEEKKGFDVQYATAAVMFFRYYGIPSRYVEGYLVTPEAVSERDAAGCISVKEQDAHAWAEIYLEETGWIPIEVLEKYEEKMGISYLELLEDSAVGKSSQAQSWESAEEQETVSGDSSEEKEDTEQNTDDTGKTEASENTVKEPETHYNIEGIHRDREGIHLLLLSGILLAILFVVFFLIRREQGFREERRWKVSGDYGFCVVMYYRKLIFLISLKQKEKGRIGKASEALSQKEHFIRNLYGLDPQMNQEEFEECFRIRQKAIYGNVPLIKEEGEIACGFLEQEIKKIYDKLSWRSRCRFVLKNGRKYLDQMD